MCISATTSTVCRFVLKGFSKDGRDLTDAETKAFLQAADKDGDGKIGIDGERWEKYVIVEYILHLKKKH